MDFSEKSRQEAYEILISNDPKPLETIFSLLSSLDEMKKTRALNVLRCCRIHFPSLLLIKLVYTLHRSPSVWTLATVATVLRFTYVRNLWSKLTCHDQSNLKTQLICVLKTEKAMPILRQVSFAVSQLLCGIYEAGDQWQELVGFLVDSLHLDDEKLQETSLLVFAHLPQDGETFIAKAMVSCMKCVHHGFLRALGSLNIEVKMNAIKASVRMKCLFFGAPENDWFSDLLQGIMLGMFYLLRHSKDYYAHEGIKELTNIAKELPQLMEPYLCDLVPRIVEIAKSKQEKQETRRWAFMFLMTLVEAKELAPALQKLPGEGVIDLFIIPLRTLLGVGDDDAWYERGSVDGHDAGKTEIYKYVYNCFIKMAIAFGEKVIMPFAFELIKAYKDAQDWRQRYTALFMLEIITNLFSDEVVMMNDYLNVAVSIILKSFRDPHPWIQCAVFHFMQLQTTVVETIQMLYHPTISSALTGGFDGPLSPRVKHPLLGLVKISFSKAWIKAGDTTWSPLKDKASALVFHSDLRKENYMKNLQVLILKEQLVLAVLFFIENVSSDGLTPYVDSVSLLRKLFSVFQDNDRTTKASIGALSTCNILIRSATHYVIAYLPILLEACTEMNLEVKKEAARGIRICAEFGGLDFQPFAKYAISGLSCLMDHKESGSVDQKLHDIAVSAIGKICDIHRDAINIKLLSTWLSFLPLKDDKDEAKIVHEQLCSMVERSDQLLLGPNGENLKRVIPVIVKILLEGDSLATHETVLRMENYLKQTWQETPHAAQQSILRFLDFSEQSLLTTIISP